MDLKNMDSNTLLAQYKALNDQIDAMVTEVRRRKIAWRTLAKEGFTIMAIRSHQDTFKSSLRQAKDAVDAYRAQLRSNQF